eukprot:TRINITY_DN27051_c0_g1_i1.p1 TRINITY_DN27051_c0_g1~~TRINITY_DN27051_c0_g1_i1.p1  ORF type:complete len:283 (+),score=56.31 TRINITY_DN27051_c0_g1_i1:23-850(+)
MESISEVFHHVEAIRETIAAEVNALELSKAQLQEERRQLEEERRLFEVEKKALRDRLHRGTGFVSPLTGNVAELNVGGTHYTTSLETLLADPDSELAALFRTPSEIPLDADGRFFLDYAGAPFSFVLKYLRGEKFFVKKGDPVVAEVYSLAHKLGLAGFKKIIEKVLTAQKKEIEQEAKRQEEKPASVQPAAVPERNPHIVTPAGSPDDSKMTPAAPKGFDPSLEATLKHALERQRTKEAAARGAVALEHVRSEETGSLAENQWEQHWQRLISTP